MFNEDNEQMKRKLSKPKWIPPKPPPGIVCNIHNISFSIMNPERVQLIGYKCSSPVK
jgi:hypothetical protein